MDILNSTGRILDNPIKSTPNFVFIRITLIKWKTLKNMLLKFAGISLTLILLIVYQFHCFEAIPDYGHFKYLVKRDWPSAHSYGKRPKD